MRSYLDTGLQKASENFLKKSKERAIEILEEKIKYQIKMKVSNQLQKGKANLKKIETAILPRPGYLMVSRIPIIKDENYMRRESGTNSKYKSN